MRAEQDEASALLDGLDLDTLLVAHADAFIRAWHA